MRILVTGGAGFIGSHLVDLLLERGHDVTVIDDLDGRVHAHPPEYLDPRAEYVTADVADDQALRRALRGIDRVSHQAALVGLGRGLSDARDYVRVNDLGTAALLAACHEARVGRLVLASSMAVYGEGAYACPEHGERRPAPRSERDLARGRWEPVCPGCGREMSPRPVGEDHTPDPRSVYAATKLHQEHLAFAAMREGGPAVTALRYHNVYGPRMPRRTPYAGVASIFRSRIADGGVPQVFEDGRQMRDFVHVSDVARANVLALEREEPAVGPFNVGSGEPHTVLDLARGLAAALGAGQPQVTGEHRAADVRHVFASSERAAAALGYRPLVPFDRGVAELATASLRDPPG